MFHPTLRAGLVALSALVATSTWGAAVYSTTATSTFTLGGPFTSLYKGGFFGTKTETGSGIASFSGVGSAAGVNPATKTIGVSGSAAAPPDSTAMSTYMSGHTYAIDNTAPGAVTLSIPFTFVYGWDVSVSTTDPVLEFARGGAYFALSGFEAGFDSIDIDGDGLGALIDPAGGAAYDFNPDYSTIGGGTGSGGPLSASVTGFIIVEAGEVGMFSVITDSSGMAESPAATGEPGSWSLVTLG